MLQLQTEKQYAGRIPVHIIHPVKEEGKALLLYHGWSSCAAFQTSKAALFALHGYTVFVADAMHHGEREALSDYYAPADYNIFWETILQNVEEFPQLLNFLKEKGYEKPILAGHSMGGMSVLGIAAAYPDAMKSVISFNGSGDWLLTHLFMQARFGLAVGRDWSLYGTLEKQQPLAHVEEMKHLPIFMTNGDADISVDPRAQAHFFETLKAHGGQVERITYPRLGHFVTTNMIDDALKWLGEKK